MNTNTARPAAKRALAAAILALAALGSLAIGEANAVPAAPLTPSIPIPPPSPGQASDVPVNNIKIGNRSQVSQRQLNGWYDIVGPQVG